LISWCDCKFNVQNSDSKIAILQDPWYYFGVTFMTLAPEHELVSQITTAEQKLKWMLISKNVKTFWRERMAAM
jgi:leucyl-tRNA synthetase